MIKNRRGGDNMNIISKIIIEYRRGRVDILRKKDLEEYLRRHREELNMRDRDTISLVAKMMEVEQKRRLSKEDAGRYLARAWERIEHEMVRAEDIEKECIEMIVNDLKVRRK